MTIEKIKQIALEKHGKTLTDEQAVALLEKHGKLSDDELDSVSGGGCIEKKEEKCNICGEKKTFAPKRNGRWDYECPNCD